jgi:hypothetical protein
VNRHATQAEIAHWREWYESGMTARQIAVSARRAHKTIISTLADAGVHIRDRNDYTFRPPSRQPDVWEEGWCDECCETQLLNMRTGWCRACSIELRRPTPASTTPMRRTTFGTIQA